MLLYPSRASPQKLDPKALGPFIGSWIGVDCPLDSGDLWAYRIELYGEQENPYFMLREIGSLEDSARLRKITKGTYKREEDMDTFTFIIPAKPRNVTWIFNSLSLKDHEITGLLQDVNGGRFGLFFQPDTV